jgi:LacI family transcriptional regulator
MARKYIVSLKDIAQETGVSISTVSRVIKKKGELSPATRDKVLNAAKKLGYHSNLLIDGMKTGKTRTIGVCATISDPYLNRIVYGIHNELDKHDYSMNLVCPTSQDSNELKLIHRLMQHRVEGVIIRPSRDYVSNDYFQEVIDSGIPLVTVDRNLPNASVNFVGSDDFEGAKLATKYLIDKGHRVIGHIQGPQYTSTGRLRQEAFIATVSQHRNVKGILSEHETFNDGSYEETEKFLLENPDMTAIFTANDNVAISVYKVAAKLGKKIPQDLSVIAFSDIYANTMVPELTAIEQKPDEVGKSAVKLIFKILEDDNRKPEKVCIKPVLVERNSVKSC